ncbi:MAG: ABC transporter permease subunit [Clostridiales bacterium]|jgi:ABC-2 type transport system permease protein|nr:ABC transporter permease subunit [Clostridiales bacterium]
MNKFLVFSGKELLEAWRNSRLLILAAIFLFFAVVSPLLSRYLNEFIAMLLPPEQAGLIATPPPHWRDAYLQFFGNLNQIGMITLILITMGVVSGEKRRGTAALMMVKGLGHTNFILSKFMVLSLVIFVVLLASVIINHSLTLALFGEGAAANNLIFGFLVYWLFCMLILSLIILSSTLAKSTLTAAAFGFLGFMAMAIISALPRIREAFPYTVSARAAEITTAGYHASWLWANIVAAIATIALFLALSIRILKSKEL